MEEQVEFQAFGKIPRLFREIVITEKIDGTNAQVYISDDGTTIKAGSRNRWIEVGDDNFGFAGWVERNREELLALGPGHHYGEWWGAGIQRRYGLDHKRFSLFNVHRWHEDNIPDCCHVVPVLWQGELDTYSIKERLELLRIEGSHAAPGFMQPEGIIVYHSAAKNYFKATLEDDFIPKTLATKE